MKVLLISEVKNILSKLSKERELSREQKISLEHSEKVAQLSIKKASELAKKVSAIGKIKEKQAYQIANLLPRTKEEVVAIFAKETYIPSDDEIEEILKLVEEYT